MKCLVIEEGIISGFNFHPVTHIGGYYFYVHTYSRVHIVHTNKREKKIQIHFSAECIMLRLCQRMRVCLCLYEKCRSISSTTSAACGLTEEMEREHNSQTTHKWPSSQQLWRKD